MEDMDSENNQPTSNLMSFDTEQLEELSNIDKTDNDTYTVGRTNYRFSFDSEDISISTDEEADPFSAADVGTMEIPKDFKPRERRVSDVIDSIGDTMPDINASQMTLTPDRITGTHESISPISSGYGSVDNGTPKLPVSPDWNTNPPSSRKILHIPRVDVTDASVSITDASPMNEDQNLSPSTDKPAEAVMPVDKNAEEYNMMHKRRGKSVIFNHDKFDNNVMPSRDGSHVDVQSLEITYRTLGFEVTVYHNLEYSQIKTIINKLAQEDHSDADCIMVTVLTHGMGTNYLLSKDVPYNVDMLWSPFTANNCLTLAGKPKLFIIQACRGEKLDPGVILKERRGSRTETDSSPTSYKIPTHADFLIAYSSVEGYFSWRNPDKGTWFIQCLCKELQDHAVTKDLLKIMTSTARRVALDHESYNDVMPWQHQQKQVPSFNSMLIRDLYFRPKI